MRRTGWAWLSGLAVCAGLAGCGGGSKPVDAGRPGRPDVLLITLDTTRVDRFSCYGYDRPTTPNFDALAADGVLFEFALATSSTTPVSHASILSGLNNYLHGVRVILGPSGFRLPEEVPTLTTLLKAKGWETGAYVSSFPVSEHFGFQHGFDTFDSGIRGADESKFTADGRWDVRANQRRSDETVDAFLRWLRERRGPYFGWVHLWDPHDPQMLPPDEFLRRFPDRDPRRTEELAKRFRGEGTRAKVASYDAEVAFVDHGFGRIVQALRDAGRYENTIIVVVSDHGEGLGDHDWMNHRLLYQEQIHVPLIMRYPGGPKGVRIAPLVRTIDIFPTVLELVGLEVPPARPGIGRSMLPLVRGEADEPRIAYADQLNRWDENAHMMDRRPQDALNYCAMDRTWKLIWRDAAPEQSELFNLVDDPHELNNLFARHPDQVSRLKGLLDEFNGYRRVPFAPGGHDAEAVKRLEALGYTGGAVSPDDGPGTEHPTPTTQPAVPPEEKRDDETGGAGDGAPRNDGQDDDDDC